MYERIETTEKRAKEKSYTNQIDLLEDTARLYVASDQSVQSAIPEVGDTMNVTIEDMMNKGLISETLIDPRDNSEIPIASYVKLTRNANETISYTYINDEEAPAITILGDNPLEVDENGTYTEPGATATDNIDGDITESIATTGTVDTSAIGTYTITYTVSDASGNETVVTRTVEVNSVVIGSSVSGGYHHSIYINTAGEIYGFGSNANGQIFNSATSTFENTPVHTVLTNEVIEQVDVMNSNTFVKTHSGKLFVVGANNYGKLGIGSTTSISVPQQVIIPGETIKMASTGRDHSGVVTNSGKLYTMGSNDYNGTGFGSDYDTPELVQTLIDRDAYIVEVDCGSAFTIALDDEGGAWTFGKNNFGQLGAGYTSTSQMYPQHITITGET